MSGTCLASGISKGVTLMRKIGWNVQQNFCTYLTVYQTQIFLVVTPCLIEYFPSC